MASTARRWAGLLDRPAVLALLLLLTGVRFVASTVTAFLGIEGVDTRTLDAAFDVFSYALIVLLFVVAGLALSGSGLWATRRGESVLILGLSGAVVILWLGVVDPDLRVLLGGAAEVQDFLLGTVASVALALLTGIAAKRLSHRTGNGLRAVGWGFSLALFLRSVRLLDFAYLLGWVLPSGVLWVLDFGPSLILAGLAILVWLRLAVARCRTRADWAWALSPPVLVAAAAEVAAAGVLGGFIASNALAWGGSYTVFAPTTVSLPIAGLGAGAFMSTAMIVGRRLPHPAAWLVFGGVAMAALSGIQTSAGTLASFAGLLAGIACVGRGLAKIGGQGT